jgi:hypothetical protein
MSGIIAFVFSRDVPDFYRSNCAETSVPAVSCVITAYATQPPLKQGPHDHLNKPFYIKPVSV